jgi:hypothetical protein
MLLVLVIYCFRPKHIILPSLASLIFGVALVVDIIQDGSIYVQMTLICAVVGCIWAVKVHILHFIIQLYPH